MQITYPTFDVLKRYQRFIINCIQIIIIMMIILNSITKHTQIALTRISQRFCNVNTTTAQQKRNKSFENIRNAIDKQLEQQSNTGDIQKYQKLFKQKGWNIHYKQKIIELAKEVNPYNLKILIDSKIKIINKKPQPLTQLEEREGVERDQEEEGEQQLTNLYVQISNEKMPLHMLLTYCLVPQRMPFLLKVQFVKDKQLDNIKSRKVLNLENGSNYQGPQINWLNSEVQALLNIFMNDLVRLDLAWKSLFPYVIEYEHNLYLEWLKDFKSIL